MSQSSRRGARRLLALAGLLIALCATLALAASPAAASPFCVGVHLPVGGICLGAPRVLTGVMGLGNEGPVCVGILEVPGAMGCSTGAGMIATYNHGTPIFATPWIRNIAPRPNTVSGETF